MSEQQKVKFWRVEIDERHKIPDMRLRTSTKFFPYGEKNAYPDYLVQLYNRSSTHAAIIKHKVKFVCGNGFKAKRAPSTELEAIIQGFINAPNKTGEHLNDILKKVDTDYELFNGFALEVIWNHQTKKVIAVYHKPFDSLRVATDESATMKGVYHSKMWTVQQSLKRYGVNSWSLLPQDAEFIPFFNPETVSRKCSKQILYFREYTAQMRPYPYPEYIACNTDIEADIEISNFDLNNVKTGFAAGVMLTFFGAEPTKDEMEELDRQIKGKMAGTDNAGQMLLNFVMEGATEPKLQRFQPDQLADQYHDLQKRVVDAIMRGHQVNNSMLFGIKTEGQLGGRTELVEAYEQFYNDYISPRQQQIERAFNAVLSYRAADGCEIEIQRTTPLSQTLSEATIVSVMTKEEIRERAGLPMIEQDKDQKKADQATLDAQAGLKGTVGGVTGAIEIATAVKERRISPEAASRLLIDLYGFDEDTANLIAGIVPDALPPKPEASAFKSEAEAENFDEKIIALFAARGIEDCEGDEYGCEIRDSGEAEAFEKRFCFARTPVLSVNDPLRKLYDIMAENKEITVPELAERLSTSQTSVIKMLNDLQRLNILDYETEEERGMVVVKRLGPVATQPPADDPDIRVTVRYKYNGPKDSKNRAFCARMLALNRLYTRQEIDEISEQVDRNVWLYRGGFYTDPNTGVTRPSCRHTFSLKVITEKVR